jgi:two-component system CheB/CheR fusion protein
VTTTETVGNKIYELGNRQWSIPALRELLEMILPRDKSVDGYMVEHDFPIIGHRKITLNARQIISKTVNEPPLILLTTDEIIERNN